MLWRPRVDYGVTPTTIIFELAQRPWSFMPTQLGGRRIAGSGAQATYKVRHDELVEKHIRFTEEEWPVVRAWLLWAQGPDPFDWYDDQDDEYTLEEVYLHAPEMGQPVAPVRVSEFPLVLELTITLRMVDSAVAATRPYFDTLPLGDVEPPPPPPPPAPDAHLLLAEALGVSPSASVLLVTTKGTDGAKADQVVLGVGNDVAEWQNYYGSVPDAVFADGVRPQWNGTTNEITFTPPDIGETPASALLAVDGPCCLVFVVKDPNGNYPASINTGDGTVSRFMALETNSDLYKAEFTSGFVSIDSGVASDDGVLRVVILSKDGSTGAGITVPNDAQVTGTPAASASGNNVLTLGAGASVLAPVGVTFKAIAKFPINPDATQRQAIRDWAIAELGAVAV